MRWPALLVLGSLACRGDDVAYRYQLVVTGYPHTWREYECRVALELTRNMTPAGVDSVTVTAGVTDTLTLTVPDRGDYVAIRRQKWRGIIATWELGWGPYWADTQQIRVPGIGRLDCFP